MSYSTVAVRKNGNGVPTVNGKPFAWSYSTLSAYELCPKKFYHEKIAKDFIQPASTASSYGTDSHKAFELRMAKGRKPLPLDLTHHEQYLARIEKAATGIGAEILTEQRIALNENLEPTGFFDADVWVRGVIDLTVVSGPVASVFDWKFGKMKADFEQLSLMAVMMFHMLPELEKVSGAYYWAKDKQFMSCKYTRNQVPEIWDIFLPRVQNMMQAIANSDMPARDNFLCRNYCPVKTCPRNGGYK
jgi:hypothetical protein